MPVFFLCFIVFIIWIHVKSKQENKKNSTWDNSYWAREQESNFVRKKNIEDLDYLKIEEDSLPFREEATGEEAELQNNVRRFLSKKMLNLSGMTNTDIKLAYGTANLTILSEYDQNYSMFIRNLGLWGAYLLEQAAEKERARQVLEFAVSLGSDITSTYVHLASIYLEEEQIEKIRQLIEHVEQSDFYMKQSIIKQLKSVIRNY